MSFLNPMLLFGLTAVSVPIIIHLLNKRKFQRVAWAAMRFVQASVEQNQRRMKMEDLLLLALRCLLLALLALALARPALRSSTSHVFGQAKVTAVIVLDNSYSMSQTDGVLSRFDKARDAAQQVVETLPAGSSAAVFLASDTVQSLIPEPTHDVSLVRKIIREARRSDRTTDLAPAFQHAIGTLKGRSAIRKEIYLITDGQAAGWRQIGDIQKMLAEAKNEINARLIFVGEPEEHNLGVSVLRLASGLTPVEQPLRFEIQVSNFGRKEVQSVQVNLSVDGDPPIDQATLDTLLPGESKSVSLFARLRSEGFHSVTARIPADRVPADDQRTVAVRAIKEVKVLLVDGDAGDEQRVSQSFFLRHALQPVPPVEAAQYFIKLTLIAPADLTSHRLDDFEAVVLANVAEFSQPTLTALEQYLRRGGGLLIFPGPRVSAGFYNDQLLKRFHFLPAALGPLRGQADQSDQHFSLQARNYDHPIVSIWNDPASGTLNSARFYRAIELQPDPWPVAKPGQPPSVGGVPEAGQPQIVARFGDGLPAIMERPWGLGRVILFASTANTLWNDLPVRPAFVPLMHRSLGSIVQRQDEHLTVKVGEKFTWRASHDLVGKDVLVLQPGQTNAARDLRHIDLVEGAPLLQYENTDTGGTYEASIAGETLPAIKFAAQPDPRESSLDELSPEQRKSLGTVAQVIQWSPTVSLRDLVEKERIGTELWLPIVVAALILSLVETFLAQRFSKPK